MSSCAQIIDAGAWVLGALPEDEATAYAAHLRGCDVCREQVAQLQTVADVLPMAAEQVAPSRELRGRVMAIVRAEAPPPRRRPLAALAGALRVRPWPVAAFAAACLGIGIVAGVLLDGGTDRTGARVVTAQVAAEGAAGELTIDGDHARLHVTRMPAPPPGHVYQVWVERRRGAVEPTDALFRVRRDGAATVDVPGGIEGVRRVLVTAEPDGGSDAPTRAPILVAEAA